MSVVLWGGRKGDMQYQGEADAQKLASSSLVRDTWVLTVKRFGEERALEILRAPFRCGDGPHFSRGGMVRRATDAEWRATHERDA